MLAATATQVYYQRVARSWRRSDARQSAWRPTQRHIRAPAYQSHMEKITIGDIPAYVIGDKTDPGVIVIQEWWGVSDDIKNIATEISKHKFRALIPDIYKGKVGVEKEEAKHIREGLDYHEATRQIEQAIDWLKSTGAKKVGCTGFCMGGALTLTLAQSGKIVCGAPCYGIPAEGHGEPENMRIPLQGHYGRQDTFFPVQEVEEFVGKVNGAGGQFELFIYDDAGHAFLTSDDHRKKLEQPDPSSKTRELAWSRIYAFFNKHLR